MVEGEENLPPTPLLVKGSSFKDISGNVVSERLAVVVCNPAGAGPFGDPYVVRPEGGF